MAPNGSGDEAPIYDSLIDEHGDVPAEARQAAEEAQRTASRPLHINALAHEQHFRPTGYATVQTEPSQPPAQPPPYQREQPADEFLTPQHELPGAWPSEPHREQ
jgi:hypothetical protein